MPAPLQPRPIVTPPARLSGEVIRCTDAPSSSLVPVSLKENGLAWPELPLPSGRSLEHFKGMKYASTGYWEIRERWSLLEEVGQGAYGTVYAAEQRNLQVPGSMAAIKIAKARDMCSPLSEAEASVLHCVAHENVVRLLDVWVSPHFSLLARTLE